MSEHDRLSIECYDADGNRIEYGGRCTLLNGRPGNVITLPDGAHWVLVTIAPAVLPDKWRDDKPRQP